MLVPRSQTSTLRMYEKTNFCCLSHPDYLLFAQLLNHFRAFVTPWTAAHQPSLSFTISYGLLKLMSIGLVMPSNHLIPVAPFSCPQSFLASESFPVSWLFASGGQSIGASASISTLPVDSQGWFPLGLTGSDLLVVQGTLKSLLQRHSSKASILQHSAVFMIRLSHLHLSSLPLDLLLAASLVISIPLY